MADAVSKASGQLAEKGVSRVSAEYRLGSGVRYAIVILPDGDVDDAALRAQGIEADEVTLLRQVHGRRKKGAATLAVLTDGTWSSVDYLGDHIDIEQVHVAIKRANDVVNVDLEKGTTRAILAALR